MILTSLEVIYDLWEQINMLQILFFIIKQIHCIDMKFILRKRKKEIQYNYLKLGKYLKILNNFVFII